MNKDRLCGLDLFSGIGGLSLALRPWVQTIAYCEIDPYCQAVLLSRMQDGQLDRAPIWDDVSTLDGLSLPRVDVVFGGFPCTDISDASRGRGGGVDGSQSGLYKQLLRLIKECKPRYVFVENVDGAAWKKWVSLVRRELDQLGYSSVPVRVRAEDVGAPFKGSRIFVAATNREGESTLSLNAKVALLPKPTGFGRRDWGKPPTTAMGVAHGIPHRMERLRALGNAVVPDQARAAFQAMLVNK